MRLDEITKDEFVRKLTDPAAQELLDMVAEFNSMEDTTCDIDSTTNDIAELHCSIDEPNKSAQRPIIVDIARRTEIAQHWEWDTTHTPKNPFTPWVIFLVRK